MGSILSSKMQDDGKVVFEIIVDYDEAKQLQGFMDNVHIFSENQIEVDANISERGKGGSTKYFLIPKSMRKNIKFDSSVTCHKIETKNKTMFIYVVENY
ncbi:hypothetical protein KY321_05060 [Candidatus Woesearchaeota archaeon]|nr:hypothetical protein [Candidatus Woesearchaeota archaeon]